MNDMRDGVVAALEAREEIQRLQRWIADYCNHKSFANTRPILERCDKYRAALEEADQAMQDNNHPYAAAIISEVLYNGPHKQALEQE
jgi:predicted translin family RNA/ssDNA-binding protein